MFSSVLPITLYPSLSSIFPLSRKFANCRQLAELATRLVTECRANIVYIHGEYRRIYMANKIPRTALDFPAECPIAGRSLAAFELTRKVFGSLQRSTHTDTRMMNGRQLLSRQ